MNDQQRAAMQMALEALDHVRFYGTHKFPAAMEALREALAQPQGEWVDLTDDEILKALGAESYDEYSERELANAVLDARAVIAAFKEKNK